MCMELLSLYYKGHIRELLFVSIVSDTVKKPIFAAWIENELRTRICV
jgi:hypothetical protein